MEWLNANIAYWHWLIFGLGLALAEILLVSFVALWFGVSAIIVGLLLWIVPFSFTVQLMLWIILSIIIVFSWFKWVSPHLKNKTFSGMSRESMIGQVGTVIEYNSVHEGRGTLRFPAPILGNDEWQFICTDTVDLGGRVMVREFSGNTLIVSAK
ncbi:inner membrane protein [Bathymodiolus japonicus methanotrophic gill symbiont]|uniref:NfeD family protein n=1 Tax=Bathymodiolus japonicus methanotrophic gill symbiont TaxID=113269 RepID=UPI001B4B2921|nr:NfeD family protein [Bathymodiolus japonicus methanotrophic gill symbiont]GFO71454.1 inner membrane protein [Bathymodiolus japonicus methanotrophic gill symbiont]